MATPTRTPGRGGPQAWDSTPLGPRAQVLGKAQLPARVTERSPVGHLFLHRPRTRSRLITKAGPCPGRAVQRQTVPGAHRAITDAQQQERHAVWEQTSGRAFCRRHHSSSSSYNTVLSHIALQNDPSTL